MKCFNAHSRTSVIGGLIVVTAGLLFGCSTSSDTHVALPELSSDAAAWIGTRVFQNECSGRRECLVHWNEGEAFPSLGIGHFIWYPPGEDGPFKESFPLMIESLSEQDIELPALLKGLQPFDAPWQTKKEFVEQQNSPSVAELREFLWQTRGLQTEFLIQRASSALNRVIDATPVESQPKVAGRIEALLQTPGGVYALIDYINFKGEGLVESERYRGQGWGLLQVLMGMAEAEDVPALDRYRNSAHQVLTRRAQNAANERERTQWLPGWLARIDTYREP